MAEVPEKIHLHRQSGTLVLRYSDGSRHELSAEFLRIHSPSAEVRGHGQGRSVLQSGKRNVKITAVEQVGNYAIRLAFDDGHDSGIYSWNYLYNLCRDHDMLWQQYLDRMRREGGHRDPLPEDTQVITIQPPDKKGS